MNVKEHHPMGAHPMEPMSEVHYYLISCTFIYIYNYIYIERKSTIVRSIAD